jgi:hypothetical protein
MFSQDYAWKPLAIGAGGYVTAVDTHPDGTIVIRTDTNSQYIWSGTRWTQLVTTLSMPPAAILPYIAGVGWEIRIAPSNSSVLYMVWSDGYIYKTTNKGLTWTRTNFTPSIPSPILTSPGTIQADLARSYCYKMAVDPFNSNIVFCDVPSQGLYTTTTGGSSPWTLISTGAGGVPRGIPVLAISSGVISSAAYPGNNGIAFDPATVSGGVTQTIYTASHGNGVYLSTNAGSTWTAISPSQTLTIPAASTITAASWAATSGGQITLTTSAPHGIAVGATFAVSSVSPSGYNGVYTALSGTTGSTIVATQTVNPGTYTSGGTVATTYWSLIAGAGVNEITVTTSTVHNLPIGGSFTITGASPSGYNGSYAVQSIVSTTKITALQSVDPGAYISGGTFTNALLQDVAHGIVVNSVYYVADSSIGIWKYASGSWTQLVSNVNGSFSKILVDPTDFTHLLRFANGGECSQSFDSGSTWTGLLYHTYTAADIPWLSQFESINYNGQLTLGGVAWDPLTPGQIIVTGGRGVWNFIPPTKLQTVNGNNPSTYVSRNLGINNLATVFVICPISGNPVTSSQDFGVLIPNNLDSYPLFNGPLGIFTPTFSIDFAISNPYFMVVSAGVFYGIGKDSTGYSTDGGRTWTVFVNKPIGYNSVLCSMVAVSTPQNFILWQQITAPSYTLDGGQTWHAVSIPGISTWTDSWGYYLHRRMLFADKTTPGTFYLDNIAHGLYMTIDGGQNWTQQTAFPPAFGNGNFAPVAGAFFNAYMDAIPGRAGELLYTSGPVAPTSLPPGASQKFMLSLDSGASWNQVGTILAVCCFGFGKAAPGSIYPTIYVVGWLSSVYGIYYSTDRAVTWTQIGQFPGGSLQAASSISGDPDIFGQAYVAFQGGGYVYLPAIQTN